MPPGRVGQTDKRHLAAGLSAPVSFPPNFVRPAIECARVRERVSEVARSCESPSPSPSGELLQSSCFDSFCPISSSSSFLGIDAIFFVVLFSPAPVEHDGSKGGRGACVRLCCVRSCAFTIRFEVEGRSKFVSFLRFSRFSMRAGSGRGSCVFVFSPARRYPGIVIVSRLAMVPSRQPRCAALLKGFRKACAETMRGGNKRRAKQYKPLTL